MRTYRRIAWGVTVALLLLAAVPAFSASSSGAITLTSLNGEETVGGVVPIEWSWTPGSKVNSRDNVNVAVSTDGSNWTKVATVPIRDGGYDWDTSGLPDFAYAVKVKVVGERIRSNVSPVYVDNTAPDVRITRPTQSQIIVDDSTPEYAVVAGTATMQADARDSFSGLADITWFLDDVEIGQGATNQYDFNQVPGPHVLSVVARDNAGNESGDSVALFATPGPSIVIDQTPDLGEAPDPGELPDPTAIPGDPGEPPTIPDLGEVPSVPDLGEAPDPGVSPDPGELPAPPEGGLPVPLPSP